MSFMDFITDNWGMFIILIGFIIALSMDVHLEERMIRRIIVTIVLLVVYTTSCYVESYYGDLPYRTAIRGILSALNYGLISFIILNAILTMFPQNKLWLFFPAVINTVACIISIPTKIVFSFSEDNHFARGPLGYLPYIANTLYLTYLFYCLFKRRRDQLEEFVMLMYIMATLVICLVMPLFYDGPISGWFYLTISSDLVNAFTDDPDLLDRVFSISSDDEDDNELLSDIMKNEDTNVSLNKMLTDITTAQEYLSSSSGRELMVAMAQRSLSGLVE